MPVSEKPGDAPVHILLVDDEPANLLALEAVLEDLGHALDRAYSGAQALERLGAQNYAVVLLDVQMQGMDGFETARRIRGREASRHTPIIFLTGHDENRERVEEAYSLGAVDYLVKPLLPVVLRAKVAVFVELFRKTEQLRQVEREQFERRLAEENARFRALTEHSSDAVILIDANATVLYSSPSTRRVLGYEPEEYLGHSGFEFVHPEDAGRIHERLAALVVNPESPVQVELRARHKNGSWRWMECVGTNLLNEPAVGAVVVNFRDITERQEAAAALRDSERRFSGFMQHLNGLAWIKDLQGRYVFANDTAQQVFGHGPNELYGKDDDAIFDAATAAQFKENDRRALAGGAGVQVVETLKHGDGVVHHSLVTKFPILGPDGQPAFVGGMAIDITERIRMQAVLRESEEQFHSLADSIPQLAWMARPDGWIVWYNQRWYQYTGMTPEQMEGWGWRAVHDPAELPRVLEHWQAALARGEPWEDTFPLRRHDGQMRWHLSRAVPVRDEHGRIVRWFGTNTDISDRIEMEAKLKEADRRKDEFLAMLAHELRNPLAPIRNSLYMLRLPETTGTAAAQALAMVERQVHNMVRLVDDLLDVSRITRGKIQLRTEPIDLAAVLQRAVEATRPLVEAHRHTLTLTLSPEPMRVVADPTRLEQVFANLLTNAAKYTERGGSIAVVTERDGLEVVVRVRDTGFGIPAAMLPHIFDLFTQGERTLDRAQGGLGIGLTLVRTLVEMHGGTVSASSGGPGKGSEFVVRLPACADAPTRRDAAPDAAQPADAGSARALNVLVVEDNRDAGDSLAMLLRVWGHHVRLARDGLSGLKAALSCRPQVVFLDIGLPGLDGYEVARRLRQELGSDVRLVAMTGYGQEDDRRRAGEAGFDAHLVKPADPDLLQRLLADCVAML